MRQIVINTIDPPPLRLPLSCVVRANEGLHCAYNILDCPKRFRQTAVMVVKEAAEYGKAERKT